MRGGRDSGTVDHLVGGEAAQALQDRPGGAAGVVRALKPCRAVPCDEVGEGSAAVHSDAHGIAAGPPERRRREPPAYSSEAFAGWIPSETRSRQLHVQPSRNRYGQVSEVAIAGAHCVCMAANGAVC